MYAMRPGALSTMGHPESVDHVRALGADVIVCVLTREELA